jgi:1-acyl-sn-glycerol-3-phosphate acyltransferase
LSILNPRPPLLLALPYAVYATVAFLVLSLVTLAVLMVLPGLDRRRRLVHHAARLALRVMGMRVNVQHPERLPDGPCVVVANHGSYLDGVVLKAALPPRFAFVIKREMDAVPLANLLLRRIGAEFVERGRSRGGTRDARRLLKAARSTVSMAFFPEGTFGDEPGLLRFHAGAFLFAVRAGLPVAPVAIRGTRRALPPRSPLPWPTRIDVEILPTLPVPSADDDGAIHGLRDAARAAILAHAGEPDRSDARG